MDHDTLSHTISKAEIGAALDHAQEAFVRLAHSLTPAELALSAGPGEWTILQYVAHIARGELVHLRLARLARAGLSLRFPNVMVPHVVRTFNRIQQLLLRGRTYEDLLVDQWAGRAALTHFIQCSDEADLQRPCFQMHNLQWAPLSVFLFHVAEHQDHHVQDIRAILAAHAAQGLPAAPLIEEVVV